MQNVQIPIIILSIIISVFIGLITYVYLSDKKANTDRFDKFDNAIDKLNSLLDGIRAEYRKLQDHSIENYATVTNITTNCGNHRTQIKEQFENLVRDLKDIHERLDDHSVAITFLNAESKINKK